jgi:hypothetical protein
MSGGLEDKVLSGMKPVGCAFSRLLAAAPGSLAVTYGYHVDIKMPYVVFMLQVLRLLIKLYESSDKPDWVSIAQCLMFLDDAPEVAKILDRLLKGNEVCFGALFLYRPDCDEGS